MREIEPGSVAAQARYHLWAGTPAVIVSSPPGAGKTTLITQVLHSMTQDADFTIAVATPNRSQAAMLANRLAAAAPGKVAVLASSRDKFQAGGTTKLMKPRELDEAVLFAGSVNEAIRAGARVVIANVKKYWHFRPESSFTDFDILVIDEAYQVTWADMTVLAGIAPQLFLVGDPGQIPPIVSCDTSRWASSRHAPHTPAPIALAALHPDDVVSLQLPSTFRCGPKTAEVLQSLYPFQFSSTRPDTAVHTAGGTVMPEIQLDVIPVNSPHDTVMFEHAANVVREMMGTTFIEGDSPPREITPSDIFVLCAHVHQTVGVRSRLGVEYADVDVLTVEQAQGSERAITIVLDPANGYVVEVPEHNADTSRFVVSVSRATAHTRWVMGVHVPGSLKATGTAMAAASAAARESIGA